MLLLVYLQQHVGKPTTTCCCWFTSNNMLVYQQQHVVVGLPPTTHVGKPTTTCCVGGLPTYTTQNTSQHDIPLVCRVCSHLSTIVSLPRSAPHPCCTWVRQRTISAEYTLSWDRTGQGCMWEPVVCPAWAPACYSKLPMRSSLIPHPRNCEAVSHPVRLWKRGSAKDFNGPILERMVCIGMLR